MFVVGVAIQWVIERFEVDEFNSLLLSFGLFIIAIRLINNIWSADFRQIEAAENPYASRALFVGDIAFPVPQLMALGAALAFARRDVRRAPPHVLRQGAARARVRPRDRRRVRRRPSPDRDADRRPRVGDGRRGRRADRDQPGRLPAARLRVGRPHLRGRHPRRDRQPARRGRRGDPDRPRRGLVGVAWTPQGAPLVVFLLLILALLFRPNGLFGRLGAS